MRYFIVLFYLTFLVSNAFAQKKNDHKQQREEKKKQEKKRFVTQEEREQEELAKEVDTNYISAYNSQIVSRIYLNKKWTSLDLVNVPGGQSLRYRPNSSYNIGVGATYKGLSVNLAYGFGFLGFLNPNKDLGVTKYLDLQTHLYGRKIIIDLFGQFYKGFYLYPQGTAADNQPYYLRPDLRVNEIGTSVQYIFNNKRFSYRTFVLQNEWQKKSCGTLLAGVEAYYSTVLADSTIIPTRTDAATAQQGIHEFRYFKMGPNIGYAYALVIAKHYYAAASVSGNVSIGDNETISDSEGTEQNVSLSPSAFVRLFAGYNSERWAVSAIYTSNNVSAHQGNAVTELINIANVRLNVTYRFAPSTKVKRVLDKIEKPKKEVKQESNTGE